ncbi:hypothetical protein [Pseudomonas mosselii]|uniref:hypothetical protein n=1 Tax=Pseudomonas mosselii TaxID=78327 RepID=UPI0012FDDB73|nr:hypothetical protein [Pseudomonas mosselii]
MDTNGVVISVLSASIGAGVAIFTNFWRTRYTIKAQDFSKRIEELSTLIGKLEVLACEYWCSQEEVKPSETPYILGTQEKVNILLTYLTEEYKKFDQEAISEPLSNFFSACTGGNFGSLKKSADPQRVRKIMITGETLKIELMKTRNMLY